MEQENAGLVTSDSLAAESLRRGGDFQNNTKIRTENAAEPVTTAAATTTKTTTATGASRAGVTQSRADTAPSYVENQYIQDGRGPHGLGVREVSSMDDPRYQDGISKAMRAEPGSVDDPSRAAELQFEQRQNAAGRDAGPRDSKLDNQTRYDALRSDVSS